MGSKERGEGFDYSRDVDRNKERQGFLGEDNSRGTIIVGNTVILLLF